MVIVKFFAVMKKLVGKEKIELQIDTPTTLRDVLNQIEKEIPKIRQVIKEGRSLISINQEMSDENTIVNSGDEIAILPPFAGG
ncbi:MAG: MoaD/ThiS family protein [Nitrospirae bacterium]|nr:MoaD/ThiS family protein [Nitrospirota bacterium]MBI3594149.1 MoaD/ThiS family protein [Nitrospirota bacterium]